MGRLENVFSWSISRAAAFDRCLRAYWWQYYGAWGGWEPTAPETTREAYLLKNLSSRWAWVGSAVHEAIERVLGWLRDHAAERESLFAGPTLDVEAEVEGLRQRLREQWVRSRAKEYLDNPKRVLGLVEHEYDEAIPNREWKETTDRAIAALRSFLGSQVFARIRVSDPSTWIGIEGVDRFHLDGVDVWAVPDFARRLGGGDAEIYDWKTGAPEPERGLLQMACYTLYLEEKHAIAPERVRSHLVYLGSGVDVQDLVLPRAEVDAARERIRASMAAMRARLRDPAANRADPEDFPMTEDRGRCAICTFRRLCGR